jgi:hypothetical protein
MGSDSADGVLLFGEFCLDRRRGGLFRVGPGGALAPVPLGSRALERALGPLKIGNHAPLPMRCQEMQRPPAEPNRAEVTRCCRIDVLTSKCEASNVRHAHDPDARG